MPAKYIIAAPGRPNANGHKRRMFVWNPTYDCYVFENHELSEQEFNQIAPTVFKKHNDLKPYPRVVQTAGGVSIPDTDFMISAKEHEELRTKYKALQARIGEPAPVTTITAAHEVSLDEALAVVQRLAPEKLRKTSQGRKPAVPQEPAMEVG